MRPWRRDVLTALGLVAAHGLFAHACDRVGLVERLLSPAGGGALALAALAAVALFALRLGVLFVLPGWLLARAIARWDERRRGAPPVSQRPAAVWTDRR